MKKMNLKQLIGSSAFYMINKTIMKRVGIEAALLLQHLIDLEDSYFKGIEFYQQVDRITNDTDLSKHKIREAKKMLVKHKAVTIKKKGLPSKDHFVINHNNIQLWFKDDITTGSISEPLEVQKVDHKDKESKRQTNNNTNISGDEDYYGKIFFKIVDNYPANRIGNRQHGLKKFKLLTKDNAKLAVTNLKRYLKLSEGFHKSLQNYIIEECYSEEWLKAEETKNNKQNDKPTTQHTDKF